MDFLQSNMHVNFRELPFFLLSVIISFTVHEFAHAYYANKFGDPTAKLLGRVTLNPAVHFDLLGMLLLVIGGFGWAKPVPVNRDNFSRRRSMSIVVSAAGPLSNLLFAFVVIVAYAVLNHLHVLHDMENQRVAGAIFLFINSLIELNLFLFIFNLIPLPPLDGYRIMEEMAHTPLRRKLQQFEQWSIFIFLLILVIPQVRAVTIGPIYSLVNMIYIQLYQFSFYITGLFGA
ncbi:site-2 protease family protein [Paenibacillus polymyxa]|nr:site-2 protease family protein [Paenibacillus polymyxa]